MLSFSQKNIDACRRFAAVPARSGLRRRAPAPPLAACAALVGALCGAPAAAAISDTIHPFVAVTVSRDSNLFRLADDEATVGPRSDTIRQVQAGATFERPIGRQILSGQAKLSKVTFGNYERLNYDGKDMLAALEWHVGNHVEGHAGASYAQSLTPFTDAQSNERNLRVQRRQYVDGAWRFHPSWRVRSGFTRDEYDYELAAQRFNERTEDAVEVGVDYLASSGSRVGLQVRRVSGDYPNKRTFGSLAIDEGYDQNELKASVYWRFSGVTQLQLLGGWVERKHAFFTGRNSKGTNGRVIVNWAPLGKVRFTGTGWREFGVVESSLVSSSLNKGVSLASVWDVSAKVRADAQIRREQRDFSSSSGVELAGASDTTRSASVGLTYSPKPALQLGLGLTHDVRSGAPAVGTGSYSANGVSFNASASF